MRVRGTVGSRWVRRHDWRVRGMLAAVVATAVALALGGGALLEADAGAPRGRHLAAPSQNQEGTPEGVATPVPDVPVAEATPTEEPTGTEPDTETGGVALETSDEELNADAGTSQVVSQGLVYVEGGDVAWRVRQFSPPSEDDAFSEAGGFSFMLQRTGVSIIRNDETERRARIEVGEAYFASAGDAYTRRSEGEDPATAWLFELVAPDAEVDDETGGDVFYTSGAISDIGEGTYDAEMTRNRLEPGEEASVVAETGPVLVMASYGAVEVILSDGSVVPLAVGDGQLVPDVATVRGGADGPSVYVTAGLGAPVLDPADDATAGDDTDDAVATPVAEGDEEATPEADGADEAATDEAGTAEEGTAEEGTEDAADAEADAAAAGDGGVDTDGDRLSDTEEAELGTDPNSLDSDSDGIDDGTEVLDLDLDPLDADTDDNGIDDGTEQYGFGGNATRLNRVPSA